jgi:hypothetical protein
MADKHIRLDSQFSVVSAFWSPDATDLVHTGTLAIDERGITFTTAPEYNGGTSVKHLASVIRLFNGSEVARVPVLHGFTEGGLCTLCQLVEVDHPGLTDHGLGKSIAATAYRAAVCVTGMHLGGLFDKSLRSARYTFTGLSEWLPKATSESWENDYVVLKVPINAKDFLAFGLRESRVHISLKLFSELTTSEIDGARLSRSVAYVEAETDAPESLSWYLDVGNRLENLFSLLTGTSLALETMFVYRSEESGTVIAKRNTHVERMDLSDCVRCSASQLANTIAIWLCESQEFRSIENLALGVVRKGKLFMETEFLSLAQALEGFHRVTTHSVAVNKAALRKVRKTIAALLKEENVDAALSERICISMSHANDPTFSSRLAELCARINASLLARMTIDPEQFVADVVVTRNFYTHAGSSARARRKKRTPLSGKELFFLNQKMRSLVRGVLLLHLEIPEEQMSALLIREATRWR